VAAAKANRARPQIDGYTCPLATIMKSKILPRGAFCHVKWHWILNYTILEEAMRIRYGKIKIGMCVTVAVGFSNPS